MTEQLKSEPTCCPEFDPILWEDKIIEWNDKKFIKDKVCTFFYIPVDFGKAMKRIDQKITATGAKMPDFFCLSEHTSKWNMNLYMAVDKDIPGAENISLSGKFYSKAYEGPFKDTGKWFKDFEKVAKSKGYEIKKMYSWYTTCPKCAKKYGKNYVVVIAHIE